MSLGEKLAYYGVALTLLGTSVGLATPYLQKRAAAMHDVLLRARSFWTRARVVAREHLLATLALVFCLLVLLPFVLIASLGLSGLSNSVPDEEPGTSMTTRASEAPPPTLSATAPSPATCPTAAQDVPEHPECATMMFSDTAGRCELPRRIKNMKLPPPEDARLYCLLLLQERLERQAQGAER